jgi:DNA-binding transcriptional ArsR family regulator
MPQQLANFKAEFFKALAHPIRVRILDCLRDGEKGVNELSEALQIEQANVSQQLAILRVRNIVVGRKSGSNVYYSVSDRTLFRLLDVAKNIFNNHLVDVRDILRQMKLGKKHVYVSAEKGVVVNRVRCK